MNNEVNYYFFSQVNFAPGNIVIPAGFIVGSQDKWEARWDLSSVEQLGYAASAALAERLQPFANGLTLDLLVSESEVQSGPFLLTPVHRVRADTLDEAAQRLGDRIFSVDYTRFNGVHRRP